ncbi:MAG: ABC transporter ATP-binding protein [Lachnospiraceae bacterium]|nr:ABC transporter ATP-binding protein [Lachnospiraceae bacterium]
MLKTLLGEVKEYWKATILSPVFMILEVIVETVIPLLMASLVNNGIEVEGGNLPHIYKIGIIMVVVAVIGLFAGVLGGKYAALASAGFAKNLRKAMFHNIQTFSFSNIDKYSTAGLVTRLTTDVTNLQMAYMMTIRMAIRALFSMVFAMGGAFFLNAKVASIYLIAVILLALVVSVIMSHAAKFFHQVFQKYDDLNASVQENVSGIRVVKAYVREEYEINRFEKAALNIYNMFVRAEKNIIVNMPIMMLTVYTCILAISWVGAHYIVAGDMETGDLMALLTYCMNILMSLMMLSMVFVMISMSSASGERIAEVIKESSELTNPENPVMTVENGSIRFDHVNFKYKKDANDNVLKDINLDIRAGETIGIIGGTGSAKTSLVSLISRLYDVTDGAVLVGGHDVREYDMTVLRNQVSVVLQKNTLFSGTIYDNLRWGDPDATDEECRRACRLACADEFIDKMPDGYNTHIEQGGANVSGGQKQRLCIARALLKKPKVLILDDSTSAVDTATDAKIRKAFAEEIPDTTKLIIAQRISSVQQADRIIVMHEGEISAVGNHEELLKSSQIYREVYESQMKAGGDFDQQ